MQLFLFTFSFISVVHSVKGGFFCQRLKYKGFDAKFCRSLKGAAVSLHLFNCNVEIIWVKIRAVLYFVLVDWFGWELLYFCANHAEALS